MMKQSLPAVVLLLLVLLYSPPSAAAFISPFPPKYRCLSYHLYEKTQSGSSSHKNKNDNNGGKGEGYKFGDVTKSFFNQAGKKLTGDDSYQFGQITKKVLQNATSTIAGTQSLASTATSSSSSSSPDYQFGDLSKALLNRTGTLLTNYTSKPDYQLGDISKEIIRRVGTGEYSLSDIILLCKILLSFGVGLTPIAGALPAKLILEMMNYGLAQEAGGRLLDMLAQTLDRRMKESVMGDADYALGDKTKHAILGFIGKDDYAVGDISKRVAELAEHAKKMESGAGNNANAKGFSLDPKMIAELADWDRKANVKPKT